MAINILCKNCHSAYKLKTKQCKCGSNLRTSKLYKVRVKLPNGSWKSKQVETLEMAKKIESKFKTQAIEENIFNIHKAPSINSVWDKYLKWAKLNKRSWTDDKARWEKHVIQHLNNMKMDKVEPYHVQNILTDMTTRITPKGNLYKPATIKQVFVLIKRVFNWSIEQKYYYGTNPCNTIDIPKFDNKVTNPLGRAEIKSLIKALDSWKNERAALVVKFGLYSGKRKNEILSLTWDNVDLENGFITLLGTNTKNKESQTIPLNQSCLSILKRAQEIRISDIVFPSSTGKHYYNSFDYSWRMIKKKAGINIRFHDLRHTYASYLASSGEVDIYTLKELLGHKTINMTQRYAHLIDGTLKKATGVADKMFSS